MTPYALWLAAFLLISVGLTWDVAWHAAFFAESASWQRTLSLLGLAVAIAGLAVYSGRRGDLVAQRLLRAGVVAYLVAMPLDALNHRSYGVDSSAWGLAHLLLYAGVGLMLAGMLRALLTDLPASRFRGGALLAGFFLCFDVVLLPNGQSDATGWFYPMYGVLSATVLLLAARRASGTRWAATVIGAAYVGYRCVAWLAFSTHGFGESAVPFWLLPLCLAIDLMTRGSWNWPARIVLGSAVLTGVGYTAIALQSGLLVMPRVHHNSALVTFALLVAAWSLAERWYAPRAHPRVMALLGYRRESAPTYPMSGRWTGGSRRPG